jgi:hypothetical protein
VQVPTSVGPLTCVGDGHVVVVKLLPAVGDAAVQELTWTLLVLLLEQLVAVQLLPELAPAVAHDAAGVGPVLATLQVVVV